MCFWYKIIFIAVIGLLPMIPAFFLFRRLPIDETKVEGPFKGLQIKLQGAFAAYFLAFILLAGFCRITSILPDCNEYDLWDVEGIIRLSDEDSDITNTQILIRPPDQLIYPNGRFFINNLLLRDNEAEKASLVVQKEGYKVETLIIKKFPPCQTGFKDYNIQYFPKDKIITIENPIVLKKLSKTISYSEEGATKAVPIEEER